MTPTPANVPRSTVRSFLLWLVLACLLPGVLAASAMFAYQYRQTHAQIERTTVLTARALMQAVDNHLLNAQAVAKVLATSQALKTGDLAHFHAQARSALQSLSLGTNVVLRDAAGRQLLNTVVDYGQPLVPPPAPEQVREVFGSGQPTVSDLFVGPVLGNLVMSVDVPVSVDGQVRYALGVGIQPAQFNAILNRQSLPPNWVTAILDRSGTIVGRTHQPETFVNTRATERLLAHMRLHAEGVATVDTVDAVPVFAYYSRSPVTQWAVVIGIPRQAVDAVFVETSALMAAGIAVLFALGTLVAWRIGGTITQAFQALQRAATDLGAGRPVRLPPLPIQEADEVAGVIDRTAGLLEERSATLRASEARFKALADNIGQLAWMANRQGTIEWYNQRWHHYTGTVKDKAPADNWVGCVHPAHQDRVQAKLHACIAAGEPWEDTFPLRGRDHHYRWFLSHAFALRDPSGLIVSWFGTHTDITEQLQAQQALLEADRRKDEFIAVLAHELRNPLAPVRTAIEILRRVGGEEPRQQRAREVIERQVAHMARLIEDLLDISRIARGKLSLKTERCDLAAITRQTCEDYRDSLQELGLHLAVDVGPLALWVDGDPIRLTQMIGNLLTNAMRFTNRGGQVEVRADTDLVNGMVLVRVSDTGVGIAPEMMERLFDPFSQASQGLARSKGGLGLGLALTRGLVELHGGHIAVHSDGLGRGARFTLSVPLAAPPVPKVAGLPTPAPRPRRILVIEDNRDAAETMAELLRLAGHEVRLALDGERGVAAALEFPPELVLSDIGLPGEMDGYAVARKIRSLPELAGVRLVALSGYADERSRERSREAGFDAHLVKPADLQTLEAAMAYD